MAPREFYESIDSTQTRAIALARAGAPDGTRVVARTQSAGRGRLDRSWWSPASGGLYLSMVVDAPPEPRTRLALGVGAEIADELGRRAGVPIRVKWPNDLLVEDPEGRARKLGGILIDEIAAPAGRWREVVGVGVNVGRGDAGIPPALRGQTASIAEFASSAPPLEAVEEWVATATLRARDALADPERAERLWDRCRALLYGRGRTVRVDGAPVGTIDGLGPAGELLVRAGPTRIAIRAGDVEVASGP